jgi:hypothetical protein
MTFEREQRHQAMMASKPDLMGAAALDGRIACGHNPHDERQDAAMICLQHGCLTTRSWR